MFPSLDWQQILLQLPEGRSRHVTDGWCASGHHYSRPGLDWAPTWLKIWKQWCTDKPLERRTKDPWKNLEVESAVRSHEEVRKHNSVSLYQKRRFSVFALHTHVGFLWFMHEHLGWDSLYYTAQAMFSEAADDDQPEHGTTKATTQSLNTPTEREKCLEYILKSFSGSEFKMFCPRPSSGYIFY